jgi:hypothetical protein
VLITVLQTVDTQQQFTERMITNLTGLLLEKNACARKTSYSENAAIIDSAADNNNNDR